MSQTCTLWSHDHSLGAWQSVCTYDNCQVPCDHMIAFSNLLCWLPQKERLEAKAMEGRWNPSVSCKNGVDFFRISALFLKKPHKGFPFQAQTGGKTFQGTGGFCLCAWRLTEILRWVQESLRVKRLPARMSSSLCRAQTITQAALSLSKCCLLGGLQLYTELKSFRRQLFWFLCLTTCISFNDHNQKCWDVCILIKNHFAQQAWFQFQFWSLNENYLYDCNAVLSSFFYVWLVNSMIFILSVQFQFNSADA